MLSQLGEMGQELSAKCPSLRRLCALRCGSAVAAQYACTRVPQGAVEPQRLPDAPPSQRGAPAPHRRLPHSLVVRTRARREWRAFADSHPLLSLVWALPGRPGATPRPHPASLPTAPRPPGAWRRGARRVRPSADSASPGRWFKTTAVARAQPPNCAGDPRRVPPSRFPCRLWLQRARGGRACGAAARVGCRSGCGCAASRSFSVASACYQALLCRVQQCASVCVQRERSRERSRHSGLEGRRRGRRDTGGARPFRP